MILIGSPIYCRFPLVRPQRGEGPGLPGGGRLSALLQDLRPDDALLRAQLLVPRGPRCVALHPHRARRLPVGHQVRIAALCILLAEGGKIRKKLFDW